jgi:hypothetical protein
VTRPEENMIEERPSRSSSSNSRPPHNSTRSLSEGGRLFLVDTRHCGIGESTYLCGAGDDDTHMDQWDQFCDPFDGPEERLERTIGDDEKNISDFRNRAD